MRLLLLGFYNYKFNYQINSSYKLNILNLSNGCLNKSCNLKLIKEFRNCVCMILTINSKNMILFATNPICLKQGTSFSIGPNTTIIFMTLCNATNYIYNDSVIRTNTKISNLCTCSFPAHVSN